MAGGHGDEGVGGRFSGAEQGVNEGLVLGGRKEPVTAVSDDQSAGLHAAKSVLERGVPAGQVEKVEGFGEVEIGVGIEAMDKAAALVAEVAFNLKLDIEKLAGLH